MKILVTDAQGNTAEKELTALAPNGAEYTTDLLGNAGIHANPDTGIVEMDADTFQWWAEYIASAELTEQEVQQLAELLKDEFGGNVDEAAAFVRNQICDESNEMADERATAIRVMAEIKADYNI